ncbi:ABC transporter substrate-binding protein [Bordetella genomosp. 12]|uniref:Leucine-binding protein domain-containing protein n=1 Tax=Bordetella genomosp. 12 TaxID=463035 RepID=A0A261VJN8_9BORD|nr:ABC transporter substrate-binding protein [Bordetella genomosp. 12]OZI73951.1 hypothetical protein CAL22_05460 [Bordetella genomosp. 12]
MRPLAVFLIGLALLPAGAGAETPPPIVLGEAHAQPADSDFAQGWRMALEAVNQAGGVMGRPLRVVPVRSGPNATPPPDVHMLFDGAQDSAQALALARQAASWRLPYLVVRAPSDRLVWQEGNRYTFRLAPSTRMRVAALAPRALALRQKRWALVHEAAQDGQEEAAAFAATLAAFQSQTEIVGRHAVTPGNVDAELLRAVQAEQPQALLLALRGADLAAFGKLLRQQPALQDLPVIVMHGEALDTPAPAGWIVATHDMLPAGQDGFAQAFAARTGHPATLPALQGYLALQSLSAALRLAQSTDAEKLVDALEGLRLDTPSGPIHYRKVDHQSTMGLFVATGNEQGMDSRHYLDGARLQLPDAVAQRLRSPAKPVHTAAAPPADTGAGAPPAQASPAFGVSRFRSGGTTLAAWPD